MKPSETIALLRRLGIQPSRKLGQNFLLDQNVLQRLVEIADVQRDNLVVEIGAGTGILTEALLETGVEVITIEYDVRLAKYLRKAMDHPRLTLIEADACRLDFDHLTGGRPYACIANLPYSISSVVLSRLLELHNRPTGMCVLLQREMGERLAASPRTKSYGALSVRTQALYKVKIERIVPPTVFFPPPEVESAAVKLTARPDALSRETYLGFSTVVKLAFSQRRKMLHKMLKSAWPLPRLDAAFEALGIDQRVRAEELTVEQFIALHEALASQ